MIICSKSNIIILYFQVYNERNSITIIMIMAESLWMSSTICADFGTTQKYFKEYETLKTFSGVVSHTWCRFLMAYIKFCWYPVNSCKATFIM